jgi:hypothetical protein
LYYPGTLIKDLFASVERLEQVVAASSDRTASDVVSFSALAEAIMHANPGTRGQSPWYSQTEQFPQTLGLSAAYWDLALLLVIHAQLVGTLEPRHNFPNSIDVH